jgi:hypothetical protein
MKGVFGFAGVLEVMILFHENKYPKLERFPLFHPFSNYCTELTGAMGSHEFVYRLRLEIGV